MNFGILAPGLLSVLFFASAAAAEVKVVDGDSLEIDGASIRLIGLDCPEYMQLCENAAGKKYECGQEALKYMQKLVDEGQKRGDEVVCEKVGTDRYKRALSLCRAGRVNLNEEIVRAGWAVIYRHDMFAQAEAEAKKAKRGIWQGKFMRPELYRILKRYGKL